MSLLLLLDQRLRFDYRILFGKCMESRQEQTIQPRFHDDIAQRRNREPMIRLKVVQDAALGAVGEDLVMDVQENLFRQRFDLKAGLIDDVIAASEAARMLAAQAI